MIQTICDLTQGHPALLQLICKKIVDIANRESKKDITDDDVKTVVEEILVRDTLAISIFWSQFCSEADRKTVIKILNNHAPSDRKSLMRLHEHGYILQEGEKWKIRVPLFEKWLRKYANM